MKSVAILMATYNGEQYLAKQIESIIAQDFENWTLYIRDDGSSDKTTEIISYYQSIDGRVKQIVNSSENHGAFVNFHYLINSMKQTSSYDYYFFCDQDDLWRRDKIRTQVEAMKDRDVPLLSYSDMRIIDNNDLLKVERVSMERTLIMENPNLLFFSHAYIWGCTVAINKQLFELVPVVEVDSDYQIVKKLSHDNFYAKFAISHGEIIFVDETLIDYRRHGKNVSIFNKGKVSFRDIVRAIFGGLGTIVQNYSNAFSQTLYMIKVAEQHNLATAELKEFRKIILQGGIKATYSLYKKGIKKQQLSKSLALYTILLFNKYKEHLSI